MKNVCYNENPYSSTVTFQPQITREPKTDETMPKPFLKRGAGLARFNLPTDPRKQPSRVRRKQPKVCNVKSKYSQETEAFKSKKSVPYKFVKEHASDTKKLSTPERPTSSLKLTKQASAPKASDPLLKQIWNKSAERRESLQQSNFSPPNQPSRQNSICDSVEQSFREKLSVQEKRQANDKKELEVFEILEDATLNSSFNR